MLKFFGWTQSDNTETTIPRCSFMLFHASRMAVATVFLCKNSAETLLVKKYKSLFLPAGFDPWFSAWKAGILDHKSSDKKEIEFWRIYFLLNIDLFWPLLHKSSVVIHSLWMAPYSHLLSRGCKKLPIIDHYFHLFSFCSHKDQSYRKELEVLECWK